MGLERVGEHDKPIEFLFGPHLDEHVGYLDDFRSAIEKALERYPDKKVLVFTEGADTIEEIARLTFTNTVKGQLPSVAYKNAMIDFAVNSFSSEEELNVWIESYVPEAKAPSEDAKTYSEVEMEILDDIASRYPGRLLLAPEGTPKVDLEMLESLRMQAANDRQKSREFLLSGDFEKALDFFKVFTRFSIKDRAEREERVIRDISSLVKREDVAAVLLKFGSFHTGIAYKLSSDGHKVVWRFDDRTKGSNYFFGPEEAVNRKMIFKNEEPAEVEWYRAMLGNYYFVSLLAVDKLTHEPGGQEYTPQDFAVFATEFSRRLVTTQDVSDFVEWFKFMQKKHGKSDPITFLSAAFRFQDGEQIPSGVNITNKQ